MCRLVCRTALIVLLAAAALSAAPPPAAAAPPTLQSVQERLRANRVVRGDFRQVRELKALSRPLTSGGTFLLVRGQGLLWRQAQPFPLRMTITDTAFRTESPGAPPVEIKAADNPLVFTISGLFLALFTGEDARLGEYFSLTFQPLDGGRWQLLLMPIRAPLDAAFAEIRLQGAEQVSELQVVDKAGDRTRIVFTNIRSTPEALTDDEQRAFHP